MKRIYHRDALECIWSVDNALDILEDYKNEELENDLSYLPFSKRKEYISKRRFAVDSLEEWIVDRAFEAPVVKNIESFIHKMAHCAASYAEDSEGYQLFCIMHDTADKLIGYFL